MHRDAQALLAQLELDVDPRTPVGRLRVGAQQVVEIAKAISFRSRVIIMDEPTSAITEQEIEVLFRLIRQLKQRGVGIIYITHKLDELPHIADDVTVFRDGRFIASEPFAGRDARRNDPVDGRPRAVRAVPKDDRRRPATKCSAVRDVSLRHPERAGRLRRPRRFVCGAARRSRRPVRTDGRRPHRTAANHFRAPSAHVDRRQFASTAGRVTIRSPQQAIAAGLALAPEDRKADGLVLSMSVAENASLSSLDKTSRCAACCSRGANASWSAATSSGWREDAVA